MPQHAVTKNAVPRPVGAAEPVRVSVPADKTYVVLIRSATGHLGARMGFTLPEITDLRLAVDEACGLLLTSGLHEPPIGSAAGDGAEGTEGILECRFDELPDALRVTVTCDTCQAVAPDTESFGWNILSALVDSLAWRHDGTAAQVELVKRRTNWEG